MERYGASVMRVSRILDAVAGALLVGIGIAQFL
jgi:hypothetical protein